MFRRMAVWLWRLLCDENDGPHYARRIVQNEPPVQPPAKTTTVADPKDGGDARPLPELEPTTIPPAPVLSTHAAGGDPDYAKRWRDGRCPVCAQAFTGRQLQQCRACGTLHHPECFDYNGGCGTYACLTRRGWLIAPPGETTLPLSGSVNLLEPDEKRPLDDSPGTVGAGG